MKIGSPRDYSVLAQIIVFTIVLSTLDGVMTVAWVSGGHAMEANPLMADILGKGVNVLPFMIVKTLLVALGGWLLWRWRHRPLAVIGAFVVFMAFLGIFLYHLVSWRGMFSDMLQGLLGL